MFPSFFEKCIALLMILFNLASLFLASPFTQTLSDLGNTLGYRAYLIIWACSTSIYFYVYTFRLMKKIKYTNKYGKSFLFLACLGIIIAVWIPFYPDEFPISSAWHTNIAILSTITYILVMYHILYVLMQKNYLFFSHAIRYFTALIAMDSLLLLYNGGVNTLLEISFTIGMITLLPYLLTYE